MGFQHREFDLGLNYLNFSIFNYKIFNLPMGCIPVFFVLTRQKKKRNSLDAGEINRKFFFLFLQ